MITLFHHVSIHARQNYLFAALSTIGGLKGWYAPKIKGKVVEGGEFLATSAKHEAFGWKILEIKPDTVVRWECLSGPNDAAGTTVTFTIFSSSETDTCVECAHAGHEDPGWTTPAWDLTWTIWLDHLKSFAETGEATPALS